MATVPSSIRRAYFLGLVTLPAANTNYAIIDLVNTLLASQTSTAVIAPGAGRELLLVGNPGVDGSGGNSNDILVGDAALSTTNYGFVLSVGSSVPFRSDISNASIAGIYVRSAGTNQKLGVTIMGA